MPPPDDPVAVTGTRKPTAAAPSHSPGTMRRMRTRTEALERSIEAGGPVDLRLTLRTLRHGSGDPSFARRDDGWWRATRTPDGPATTRFVPENEAFVRA